MWRIIFISASILWYSIQGSGMSSIPSTNPNGNFKSQFEKMNPYDTMNEYDMMDPYNIQEELFKQFIHLQNSQVSTYSTGDGHVQAYAFSSNFQPPKAHALLQQQKSFFENLQKSVAASSGVQNREGTAGTNYAIASASIGPDGNYQTAYINPENPQLPNVVNRFSPASSTDGEKDIKSVSVSSFVSSSQVDGKVATHRSAKTTINDNGQITSYTAHS